MRVISLVTLCLMIIAPLANAQIPPRQATVETMGDPSENWFITLHWGGGGAYIFDGITGEMQGLLSLSPHTPAIQANPARNEF